MAVELARRQIGRRPDGVWIVDLTTADITDVISETARTLGVRGRGEEDPGDALREYLADRELLLVLDNCEHVIEACAGLSQAVLSSCERVRILATSREPLDIGGESIWRLEPLTREDAYRLFIDRGRRRRPDYAPDEETDLTVERLLDRLDRLPLAIELAAARVGAMSAQEILSSLDAREVELGGGSRHAAPRHRTVHASVEWSYELLDRTEQRALRHLSVFVGGCDADAAIAVAPGLTLEVLGRLVDKSVVTAREGSRGSTRYRLLEIVREFAHELLVGSGELEAARDRHLQHFAVESFEHDGWPSTVAETVLDELEDDYANVRAALHRAAGSDPCAGARLLVARRDLFFFRGQVDGLRLAELLLERCSERGRHRAELLITAGLLAMTAGDASRARRSYEDALELSGELEDSRLEAWAHFYLGLLETLAGSVKEACRHLEASRAAHKHAGVLIGEGLADAALGLAYARAGDVRQAPELLERALAIQSETGYRWGQGQAHLYLGLVATSGGAKPIDATSHFRNAVECLRPYGESPLLPVALIGQASVMRDRDPERALALAAAAWTIRTRIGGAFAPLFLERAEAVRDACEAALGDRGNRIWTDGARLNVDDAIALAFGKERSRPSPPGGLSAREIEVAGLVAEGLSNKVVAARLHLSVRTVESHVRHALAKLGLENRTQLATWARDRIPRRTDSVVDQ
jgi:non-specific serine/threonine protein kinase